MATTAHPAAPLGRGSAPRFGMAWVTWRQQRAALAGACALLGVMILYMLVTGRTWWAIAKLVLVAAATVWLVRRRAA